ncbi:short chain dehydrogenase [Colletotrichum musicola]|uniref:Short chain dehydrogenase n=1 Tax=Colletotrichum musicola TaxID=2175873 RepID=A0A8H6N9Z8_9PEZI|nr:short chain dehydrogenase [Colletotrichum musicola]
MPAQWDPLHDTPSLAGKVAVVTGGNSPHLSQGIGFATVKYLALRGAKVYFTARSKAKADHARERLRSTHPDINQDLLVWLPLDLSDLKTVRDAAEELASKEDKVDILINNAGVASASTETARPGWEWHMAVNHVGHFVFTNAILPLLKAAAKQPGADVRIVTLSSNVNHNMFPAGYKFTFNSSSFLTQPVPYYPLHWRLATKHMFVVDMIRYAASKVANMLFAQELQRLLDEQGLPILSISVHPGGVDSEGCRTIGGSFFSLLRSTVFLTSDQGAVTSLFAATAAEVHENAEKFKGRYLEPYGTIVTPHPVAQDKEQVRGMWDHTTTEVNKYFAEIGLSPLKEW